MPFYMQKEAVFYQSFFPPTLRTTRWIEFSKEGISRYYPSTTSLA